MGASYGFNKRVAYLSMRLTQLTTEPDSQTDIGTHVMHETQFLIGYVNKKTGCLDYFFINTTPNTSVIFDMSGYCYIGGIECPHGIFNKFGHKVSQSVYMRQK